MHWTHFAPESVTIALFLAAIISGGWFIAPKAVAAARRLAPDMNLLMTIAVLGAAGIGEWSEGASVRSGGRVPLDGAVVCGTSSIDQAPITGESMPAEKKQGDQVFAETIDTGVEITNAQGQAMTSSTRAR